jgi:hypothetical protein
VEDAGGSGSVGDDGVAAAGGAVGTSKAPAELKLSKYDMPVPFGVLVASSWSVLSIVAAVPPPPPRLSRYPKCRRVLDAFIFVADRVEDGASANVVVRPKQTTPMTARAATPVRREFPVIFVVIDK